MRGPPPHGGTGHVRERRKNPCGRTPHEPFLSYRTLGVSIRFVGEAEPRMAAERGLGREPLRLGPAHHDALLAARWSRPGEVLDGMASTFVPSSTARFGRRPLRSELFWLFMPSSVLQSHDLCITAGDGPCRSGCSSSADVRREASSADGRHVCAALRCDASRAPATRCADPTALVSDVYAAVRIESAPETLACDVSSCPNCDVLAGRHRTRMPSHASTCVRGRVCVRGCQRSSPT